MVVNDRLRKESRHRRSTKILRCALYFQLSSRCLIWWLNTSPSHALCITSHLSHLILAWKVLDLFFTTFFFEGSGGGGVGGWKGIRDIWTLAKVNLMLCYITVGNWTIPARAICLPCKSRPHPFSIYIYKITKIVRALWLAKRSVYMRVCKHKCGVKVFCFSRANHVSTNLKKFSSSKLDKFILFTHSFVGWYKHSRSWENSQQLCKPSTSSQVCVTVSNFPNSWSGFANTETFPIA